MSDNFEEISDDMWAALSNVSFEESIIKQIKHLSNEITQLRLLLLDFMEQKDV